MHNIDNIFNHFKGIYSKFYKSTNDKGELNASRSEVEMKGWSVSQFQS